MPSPASLRKRALKGLGQFLLVLAALVMLPAWSLRYWQGWVFLAVAAPALTLINLYFLDRDPALVERRLKAGAKAEKEPRQKVILRVAALAFPALVIFPGLDHRFGWSSLPPALVLAGNVLVLVGLLMVCLVLRENSHASATIEVTKGQPVISTGPYRLVRHPMYSGALVMCLGVPLALGSAWGLLFCLPLAAVLVWRLVEEEKYLAEHLPGYAAYQARTRYRLIPGLY